MVEFTRGGQIEQTQYVVKASDQSKTSDVSLAADDDLFATVRAGAVYAVECFLMFDAVSDGPSFQLDFDLGANPADTSNFSVHGFDNTVPANTWFDLTLLGTGSTNSTNVSPGGTFNDANNPCVHIVGTLFAPSGADATFALRWAQNVSSATAQVLHAGSWMRLTRLS